MSKLLTHKQLYEQLIRMYIAVYVHYSYTVKM